MKKTTSSFGPSLIELIVAVTVFALVSAICVQFFVKSSILSRKSADLSRAIIVTQSAAECFKATASCHETAELMGGEASENGFTVYLSKDMTASAEALAEFVLTGTVQTSGTLAICDLSLNSIQGEKEIFALAVAGRGAVS